MGFKKGNMQKSMIEGNTLKLILNFSIPLLLGNLFQQFYNVVDAAIGSYGDKRDLAGRMAGDRFTGGIAYRFLAGNYPIYNIRKPESPDL